MDWTNIGSDLKHAVKTVYDWTSSSKSPIKYAYPFNGQVHVRRWYGGLMNRFEGDGPSNSASSYSSNVHGPTGSIVGKY